MMELVLNNNLGTYVFLNNIEFVLFANQSPDNSDILDDHIDRNGGKSADDAEREFK